MLADRHRSKGNHLMTNEWAVVGGFPVWADGRVHTTFTHNPSTLRLSSADPNLQNIPRGNDPSKPWGKLVKQCFETPPGWVFWERDFSAIEAVLVGYFAGSKDYVRFAKLGVHAYLASHIAGRPADLGWSDADLKAYFKALKGEVPVVYDTAKRVVHGSNYMMTPRKMMYEYPETFPTIKDASTLQSMYYGLFPAIQKWHRELATRVDGAKKREKEDAAPVNPWELGVCHVRNPFGYVHRFYNVLDWERIGTDWVWTFGEDAKRLVAFLPQSTAAAIIKQAARQVYYDHPTVGESLRLLIHDSIIGESREEGLEECLEVSRRVMEAPIPQLPLDPTWGMGDYLSIGTEAKVGRSWGSMQ